MFPQLSRSIVHYSAVRRGESQAVTHLSCSFLTNTAMRHSGFKKSSASRSNAVYDVITKGKTANC